ncbi:MAG TPA: cytochrome b/b6 domain-containing protein [Actinomycetota bacterium]|nr:cytochrome b/b6 domain-containing protein [Actinomycetota bacterium]
MREAGGERLLRNRPAARRLHAGLYVLTLALLASGVALLGEGIRPLEGLFGGHVASARAHRWLGYGLIGAAALVALARPRAAARFLADSARFRRGELAWFASYPAFLLRPSRNAPARHEGHFDPGQRVFNLAVVAALLALSVTGLLMSFPRAFVPAVFAWSLKVHLAATWALAAAVAGHVLVASGALRAYRGAWRAMHARGLVPRELAERLWPAWAERQGPRDAPPPRRPRLSR